MAESENKMIYRTKKNANNPYMMLNKAAVNDDRLSYKAAGIHTYLMSKPDSWEANETDICKRHTDGKSAIRSGVQELLKYGYMVRVQIRKEKKIVGWRLDTYETPELNPHYDPNKEPEHIIEYLDSENRNVGLDSEKLDVENQNVDLDSDFLDVGNRNHSNYRKEVSNEIVADKQQPAKPASKKPRRQQSKAYVNPETGVSTTNIMKAYEEALKHAEPKAILNYGQESKAAKELASAGWKVSDVTTCFWKMRKDPYWNNKHLGLSSVAKQIGAIMGDGKSRPPAGTNDSDKPYRGMTILA